MLVKYVTRQFITINTTCNIFKLGPAHQRYLFELSHWVGGLWFYAWTG